MSKFITEFTNHLKDASVAGGFVHRKAESLGAKMPAGFSHDHYFAYDNKDAFSVMLFTNPDQERIAVIESVILSKLPDNLDPKQMLTVGMIGSALAGFGYGMDGMGRLIISSRAVLLGKIDAAKARDRVNEVVKQLRGATEQVRKGLIEAKIPASLANDKFLAKQAEQPVKLTARELEMLAAGELDADDRRFTSAMAVCGAFTGAVCGFGIAGFGALAGAWCGTQIMGGFAGILEAAT